MLLTAGFFLAALASPQSAQAAVLDVNQCNGIGPGPGGATTVMQCSVTVVNTINGATRGSVTTVTRLCANDPCGGSNGTFVSRSTSLVTSVTQCNASDNDAAHPITCRVSITNNISADTPGARPVTAATVNQCVGSATGGGGTVNCDPFPATTTGATVTQCNGSGNGGGGTVHCTVPPSTISAAIPIRVNQCNGTGNPGGSVVTCSTTIQTNITPAAPPPTSSTSTTTITSTTTSTTTTSSSTSPTSTSTSTSTSPTSTSTSTSPTSTSTSTAPTSTTTSTGPTSSSTSTSTRPTSTSTSTGPTSTSTSSRTSTGAAGQVSRIPSGGVQAGGGSTSGVRHSGLLLFGGALLLASLISSLLRWQVARKR